MTGLRGGKTGVKQAYVLSSGWYHLAEKKGEKF